MLHGGEQAPGRRARWALAIATLLLPAATPLRAQPTILARGTVFRPPVPPPAIGFGRVVGGRGQSRFRADGSGPSLILGAPLAHGPGGVSSGRVYSFSHPYDANEVTVLDSPSPAVGGQFGAAVAPIDPGDVLIGAPGGKGGAAAPSAAVFPPPPPSPPPSPPLPPPPPPPIETVPTPPPIAGEA